jgi:hypothetical protein
MAASVAKPTSTILVVDDDDEVLTLAVDILEMAVKSQTTDEFPELKRLARKWHLRPEDV